ncbi:MAG: alpha-L-fucosidase [Armatimonadota bacterium]
MKRLTMGFVLLAVELLTCASTCVWSDSGAAADQHSAIGITGKSRTGFARTVHPDAQWYPNAGLGIFIHWGISSLTGKTEISWGMMKDVPWDPEQRGLVTPRQYFALADRFNPKSYDPDKWLKTAKAAGFRYVVLTTKHHDGYALWPSKYGTFSTRTHMGGRDLVRPYVRACRKYGLKVGLYYSPPDWYFYRDYMSFGYATKGTLESPHLGLDHEPTQLKQKPDGFDEEYRAYVRGQVEELLTRYGKIDLLWFDGSAPGAISVERIRQLQPGIVINDRQHGVGDFATKDTECQGPKNKPVGWWERCESAVGAWAYTATDYCRPFGDFTSNLVSARSWGGNYLPDFAPDADGKMPDKYYRYLKQLATWMHYNGESIHDVSAGPYPENCNVPVATRGKIWYVYCLPGSDEQILLTDIEKPSRIAVLRTGENISFEFDNRQVRIRLPESLRTKAVDVLKVSWE